MALFFPEFWTSYQVRPENCIACPAEAFNLVCSDFRRIEFSGSEFCDTQPWTFFLQNRNCSLSTLTFRPLAGFLLTISMSMQAVTAINAPVSRLVIKTHGRMPIITRRFSTFCSSMDKELYLQSQVWPQDFSSVRRQSVLFPSVQKRMLALYLPPLCSLFTAGLRPDPFAFSTSSAVVSRFPEARVRRKLQDSPFEQDPFAFHWKHSPVFRLVMEFCPFPSVTAARSVISLWKLKVLLLWACQIAISHTFVCDSLVVLLLAEFLDYIVPQLSELGRNLATWRRSDLLKPCPDGGSLVSNHACSHRKSKSWMSSFSNLTLNNPDNPWNFIFGSSRSKIFIDHFSNLSPSKKSVVLLSSLLLDTDLLAKVCLLLVAPLQCWSHHEIQFFIIREIFALLWILKCWGRPPIWLLRFLQHPLQSACGILRLRANLC